MNDSISVSSFNLPSTTSVSQTLLSAFDLTSGGHRQPSRSNISVSTTHPNIERVFQQEHRHSSDSESSLSQKGSALSGLTNLTLRSEKQYSDNLIDSSHNVNVIDTTFVSQKNNQFPDPDSVKG